MVRTRRNTSNPESTATSNQRDEFYKKVQQRFGIVPNFFRSAQAAPGLIEELWKFAESAYFNNPLPSLFKERLFVHLSRFCHARYCIVRHVGFLVGLGHAAGDPAAKPQRVEEVAALLKRPAILPPPGMELVFDRLESAGRLQSMPAPGTPAEHDFFLAASALFLVSATAGRARDALRIALGDCDLEFLIAYLAFVRTAHYWTEIHPEIVFEEDMAATISANQTLEKMLLSTADATAAQAGDLHDELVWLRRERQVALQQSEEQFKRLVQGVTDYAIFMLDPAGIVINWNAGARRIKGYEPHEIIGQHFSTFYSREDREAGVPAKGLEIAATTGHWETEGWRVRKDGSRFWASVVIERIIGDDGSTVGFAKITRDVSERREGQIALERAQEAMFQSQKTEALGQLTGGMAHDFNNLLMAVLGSLELLGRRLPPDPKLRQLLNNAFEGARRGASLTQRMLSFARRGELTLRSVSVSDVVAGMTELLQRSLGPQILVEIDVPPDLPTIKADAIQLESAILNLAVNARDAMPHGGIIEIRARLEKSDRVMGASAQANDCVVLSVSDAGAGMDEATLRRAMEPFFTTKEPGKGTGLGLSMVHGLTEQLGGRVRISSKVGAGTTVELWLPIVDGANLLELDLPTTERAKPSSENLVIAVVDDDPLVLANTVATLEDKGYIVLEASSGAQALDLIRKSSKVDIVITDQAMPQITGLQLAAAIRIEWPELPILLVSGYAELPSADPLRLPKLAKPYSNDDLQNAIDFLMQKGDVAGKTFESSYRK